MTRHDPGLRDRAIAAALTLARDQGGLNLTLDAVARAANISKGGLLHHFRSKEALLAAMVDHAVNAFEQATHALAAVDPNPVGRNARAFLTAVSSPQLVEFGRALLSAVAHDAALLEPMHQCFHRCHARIEDDGLDVVDAHMCILAADALWLHAVFGLPLPPPQIERAVRARLVKLCSKESP